MGNYTYLVVLGLCLVVTLPLELFLGTRVYLRFRDLALVCVPVAVLYSLIDVAAIAGGLWHYAHGLTVDAVLPGALPIEEVAFFVVIPVCAILTYEAVGRVLRGRQHA